MKLTMILTLLILCSAAVAYADIYKWTDKHGVINFSDDPSKIPSKYRSKAHRIKDAISTREREEKALQSEITAPRAVTTSGSGQSVPPSIQQATPEPQREQLKSTPPGMKQPVPAPLGDQPKQAPLRDQPKPLQ